MPATHRAAPAPDCRRTKLRARGEARPLSSGRAASARRGPLCALIARRPRGPRAGHPSGRPPATAPLPAPAYLPRLPGGRLSLRSEGCRRLPSAGRPWPAPYVKRRRPQRQAAEGGRQRAAAAPLRYLATASAPGQPTPRSISFRPGAGITSVCRGSALVLWVGEQQAPRSGFWGPEDRDTTRPTWGSESLKLQQALREGARVGDPYWGTGAGLCRAPPTRTPPRYTCPRPLFAMSWDGWSGRLNIKSSIKKKSDMAFLCYY